MTHSNAMEKKIHEGRNVKRFREMLGIKQEMLAYELGDDWNQKKISILETKETIDVPLLQQISAALKIPVEAFQNFDEEQAVNIISNTFQEGSVANNSGSLNYTFNPLEKVMELFERLLASEREKVELMKEILEKMK
ncbi:helix-turn-helix domain-containing protein [Niabella drilacis]|uniref:Helix-turn-helix domain-containing protein n=1 Tax=Niabella drilacis (strain DSM 25811 / CCM 8410 / CCUG 62505 / LMG 26954 / E90) TaxID=1285928 RepID=A0A1G6WDI2_NIADE|nr:helix-turn-helix transcriptional regulator [Niabella drilacis]SDD63849.1 Helix-turn-helix domain-containing protein [Niabella drilacis]